MEFPASSPQGKIKYSINSFGFEVNSIEPDGSMSVVSMEHHLLIKVQRSSAQVMLWNQQNFINSDG